MIRYLLVLLLFPLPSAAVVIRDDVDDAEYRIAESWHPLDEVMLGGMCLKVEKLVVHPGFTTAPEGLFEEGGDLAAAMRFQAGRDDIALIKLAAPVRGIAPIPVYRAAAETGAQVVLVGKGATGTGTTGFDSEAPHRTELRRAYNMIATADERWLGYVFDAGASALPREGAAGNGDSGGPLLLEQDGRLRV